MQLRLSRSIAAGTNTDPVSEGLPERSSRAKATTWLARLAAAGFLFFLIKGLFWIAIGGLVVIGLL